VSTSPNTEILLGCDPVVRVVIMEDDGNLALQFITEDPENTDLDAIFFNLTDDSLVTSLTAFPTFNEDIGSNGENVTDIDFTLGGQNQLNNGAQVQGDFDVKLEFGDVPFTSLGDVDLAQLTIYVDSDHPLTADSIDLSNITAVVNSDGGSGQALTAGDGGSNTVVTYETVTAISEDFDDRSSSDDINTDDWRITKNDELMTNSRNDGTVELAPVETDGPVTLSFDARTNNASNFENSGRYEDEFSVQVRIDGGEWVTLDTFQVNDEGTALEGDTTGQSFGNDGGSLSYSGGILDTSGAEVEFRLVSDISAANEKIFIDDIQVTVVDAVETVADDNQSEAHCEDFEEAEAGDTAALQFDGFSVMAQRRGDDADSENDAMIFDTANPTGGDNDLGFADQGNAIIISEDNDSDDPDDNAGGGTISIEFDEVSDVTSLTLLDIEGTGTSIDLYDINGELIDTIDVVGTGDNTAQEVAINTTGVASIDVNLHTSGAVDDLCFTSSAQSCPHDGDQYDVSYGELFLPPLNEEELALLEQQHRANEEDDTEVLELM